MKAFFKIVFIFLTVTIIFFTVNSNALADSFELVIESNKPLQVYMSPGDSGSLAFAYVGDTLLASKNSGAGWTRKDDFLLDSLAFLPDGRAIITGHPTKQKRALFTSNDGTTWNPVNVNYISEPPVNVPLTVVSAGNKLLGIFNNGMIKVSEDGGLTWPQTTQTNKYNITAIDDEQIYLNIDLNANVYRTDDGGETWTKTGLRLARIPVEYIQNGMVIHSYKLPKISAVPGLAVTYGQHAPGIIYISRDDGKTWSKIDSPRFVASSGKPPETAYCTAVTPGGLIFAGTSNGVLVSEDYGETWKQAGSTLFDVTEIACQQAGDRAIVLASAKAGLYRLEYTKTNLAEPPEQTTPDTDQKPTVQDLVKFVIGENLYYSNSNRIPMDAAPFISEGRALVPVRYLADALGAKTYWNGSDQKIVVTKDGTAIESTIGSAGYLVKGASRQMDTFPVIANGRTYLPARYVAEALGYSVSWNGDAQSVTIISNNQN